MTLDEFFADLAGEVNAGRLAFCLTSGPLRLVRDRGGRCPLCALAWRRDGRFKSREAVWVPAARLGLGFGDGNAVTFAADSEASPLRGRLLAACGLAAEGGVG